MPPRHSKFHIPRYLGISCVPPSLKKAICSFVLSTAARKARGQDNQHNTMLVHVTRFVDVQHRIKEQIEEEFFRLRDRIRYEDGDRESILTELRAIWDDDFIQTSGEIQASDCKELSWEDVEEKLLETVSTISIREINGTSGDILEYEKRKSVGQAFNVIAIGGDKLSRGLTLEGLTVSYFLRHSKMYDTLMQMGRWFGYKPGYLDMCRIYTTDDLQNWFRNIAIAGEELRQDFNRMMICGYTPRQFGHRVCNHPQMMVTSPVKMRYTERRTMSFEGCITEPLLFPRNPKIVNENFIALQELLTKLEDDVAVGRGNARKNKDRHLWQGILPDRILAFLDRYQGHPGAIKARPEYIKKYIEKQVIRNKLKNWTIFLAPGEKEKEAITDRCEVNLVRRTWFKRPENVGENDPYRVRRVGSSDHEYIDLTKEEYENAYRMTTRMWVATAPEKRRSDYPKKPNGPGIRFARPAEQGLICFYPISAEVGLDCPKIDHPLIGFFISFPGDISADPIQYTVNEVFRRQEEEGFWDE